MAAVGTFFLITDDNHENHDLDDFLVTVFDITKNVCYLLQDEVELVVEPRSEHYMENIIPLDIFLPTKDLRQEFFRLRFLGKIRLKRIQTL